jgi:hypothetical protein
MLFAQLPQKQYETATAARVEAAEHKLTSDQQRGLRLLKAAQAEAAELQPDMRAFVLWRSSYAYSKVDPKLAQEIAVEAFTATQQMEDPLETDRCGALGTSGDIKSWIQRDVFEGMIRKDQVQMVEQLLPKGTYPTRNSITAALVKYYESKRELSKAESLLSQLSDSDNYPFGAASDLISALGPDHSDERASIFIRALNNYEQHAAKTSFGGEDIGSFIERTWTSVPPALALEAIDKVLNATKEQDSQSEYTVSSAKGSLLLKSNYELRLFQLLPVVQELDKGKAESLLSARPDLTEQLKSHPEGMTSFLSERNVSYGVSYGGTGVAAGLAQRTAESQLQMAVDRAMSRIDTDPQGALASALALPLHGTEKSPSPRSKVLVAIAEKTSKKDPSVSKSALEALAAIDDQLAPQEMDGIEKLPELYIKLGNIEAAQKAVTLMVKAAGKLYDQDTDAEDPNRAFKGAWPSADLWRKAIQQASQSSREMPESIIADIPDQEIAVYEKIILGSALLQGSSMKSPILVSDCRKRGITFRVSF